MFIDKGVAAGEVITFRLSSGEEVIGKLVEETATGYKLSKPMTLSPGPQGIGLIPFILTVHPDKEIVINKSHVMVAIPTGRQFSDQYLAGTTGIAMR